MFKIEKITSHYEEEEDRLQLAVIDGSQRTQSLWLTRRLANQLIGVLLGELEVSGPIPADAHTHSSIQAWEQSAANAQLAPLPPVRSESAQSGSLITSVDVMHGDDHFGLVFKLRDDRSASITLNSAGLRQWLGIVHKLYNKAEWPCDGLWPDWITGELQFASSDINRGTRH